MREVRMTFGEHLEDLRSRIIISIIYLAIAVAVCFVYGDSLMEVAMWPHRRAFGGTRRDRLIERMEKTMRDLEPLTTSDPTRAMVAGKEFVKEGDFHWGAVFGNELLRERLSEAVVRHWQAGGQKLEASLTSISEEDRKVLRETLLAIGQGMAGVFVQQTSTGLKLTGAAVRTRFERLVGNMQTLRKEDTTAALKSKVGWGKDLDRIVEPLERFGAFLNKRYEEIKESATPEKINEWARNHDVSAGLGKALDILEESYAGLTSDELPPIHVIDYTEQFTAYLKVVVIFGLFLSVPFILYELWKFVGAGLYLHEQRYVVTFMPFSLALFLAGGLFGYFVLIPVGLEFLAGWNATDVELSFRLGNYIGLFLTLTLILGVIFQTPLVMVFLNKLGIVSIDVYRKARRISVFAGVCLAVVLTPPDPFSWSLMAAPMILLYELGIIVCRLLAKQSAEEDES